MKTVSTQFFIDNNFKVKAGLEICLTCGNADMGYQCNPLVCLQNRYVVVGDLKGKAYPQETHPLGRCDRWKKISEPEGRHYEASDEVLALLERRFGGE